MKLIKNLILLIIITSFLNSCGDSVKNAVTGKRISNADEFLIQKKNPLVLPPGFEDLPEPAKNEILKANEVKNNSEIKELLGNTDISNESDSKNKTLDQNILKKINEK